MTTATPTFAVTFDPKVEKKITDRTGKDPGLRKALARALDHLRQNPIRFSEPLFAFPGLYRTKVGYRHRLVYGLRRHAIHVLDFETRERMTRWY
jgi:hypothetical protein